MATKRDLEAIEARRLEGARLLKRKVPQAEVARQLEVSRQSVSRWAQQLAEVDGAIGKLKARALGRPRRPKLVRAFWQQTELALQSVTHLSESQ